MDREAIVIRLELSLAEGALTGRATMAPAPPREFDGWIGLLAALDGLIATARPESSR